jgi:hypothetical protein
VKIWRTNNPVSSVNTFIEKNKREEQGDSEMLNSRISQCDMRTLVALDSANHYKEKRQRMG